MGDIIWLNVTQYAQHRGISKAAVSKAIKNGKLNDAVDKTGKRPKINRDLADQLWDKDKKLKIDTPQKPVNNQGDSGNTIPQSPSDGQRYAQSRAMKEIFAAKNEQLKYEERAGNLCRTDDVAKAAMEMARVTRDYLLNLPDKLSPILSAETDINEVHRILTEELTTALKNLSDGKIF